MLRTLTKAIPFALRVELLRLARYPAWLIETPTIARRRAPLDTRAGFVAARHASPLQRGEPADQRLQAGKERNVALAAAKIDGLIIEPGQVFSYHRAVGRPSRLRGFREGLELHDGKSSSGVGGGCCQVSNMLYLLCLLGGMKVIERHRHGLDLFPDRDRTVPFGCGATVFYNYADLRFENPLPQPAVLRLGVLGGELVGGLALLRDPGWRVEIYQQTHRFYRKQGCWIRENRVRRRFIDVETRVPLLDEEVSHNVARTLYEPAGAVRRPLGIAAAA